MLSISIYADASCVVSVEGSCDQQTNLEVFRTLRSRKAKSFKTKPNGFILTASDDCNRTLHHFMKYVVLEVERTIAVVCFHLEVLNCDTKHYLGIYFDFC
jgi:hypothetical protein